MTIQSDYAPDWARASEPFDELNGKVGSLNLASANEAQTRFDVIDQFIRNVLEWKTGQISVEEPSSGKRRGFVDYLLRVADSTVVIEAKKAGAAFPSPTRKGRLKLSGNVLGTGEIAKAIAQAEEYATTKSADVVCVTNGTCWCFFSTHGRDEKTYATLLFPFKIDNHPSELYNALSEPSVRDGGLEGVCNYQPQPEDRLISILHDADGRVDRNNIADHILPALNEALYADALTSNPDSLEKCFVATEGRSKFDSLLGMHLADPKPTLVRPAKRIRTGQEHGPLEKIVSVEAADHAPPVTLIIGPVGAGKSTYLKHFELVSGRQVLEKQGAHWIYIDFEEMGKAGKPRGFLYAKLKTYLLSDVVDYKSLVEPAYRDDIEGLARGPLARISSDRAEFNRRTTDYIQAEFDAVEPYVDRLFGHLAKEKLCVIVLDNIDLYEDEELETAVFAEGLALSKRLKANVIVSLRDRTFVRHHNSAAFNAYELRKLWLDPPPFRSVLSKRLAYSRSILKQKSTKVTFENGMQLVVPDLGVFFEIVQRSVLRGPAGEYIEDMSDLNIRRGLTLITSFLTSGHIQADRALKAYIEGETRYYFPFHEVFKGTALGQWKHYKEARAECLNLFDSRTGVKRTRLLRLGVLAHLMARAEHENTLEVAVSECVDLFASCGASERDVIEVLTLLQDNGLVRTATAEAVAPQERVVITRSGGYYLRRLCRTFVYVEQCMMDTAIEDPAVWKELCALTHDAENESSIPKRMQTRRRRLAAFMDYLGNLEGIMITDETSDVDHLRVIDEISKEVLKDADEAVSKASRYYPD